jgi:tRNA(adenine34) deaminase
LQNPNKTGKEMTTDEIFMQQALEQAKLAYTAGEVPVGAIIVHRGVIIARAYNTREGEKNALRHAEVSAIDMACTLLGGWRIPDATMYVTLEPCPMCAGAIVNARIDRVVYGAPDIRAGAFGSLFNLNDYPLNHKPELSGGVLKDQCATLLRDFFKEKRAGTVK